MRVGSSMLTPDPAAGSASTDPLGKVYELMDSLAAKIVKEGEEEAKRNTMN